MLVLRVPPNLVCFWVVRSHDVVTDSGLNIHLETRRSRASKGGMGSTKCAGNYAAALKPLMDCKKHGFHDNLFLELDTYEPGHLSEAVVQEMSAANVFFVLKTGEIVTPSLDRGTILPGVTRESVLQIINTFAEELLPIVKESTGNDSIAAVSGHSRTVTVSEIANAVECFATGTAAELVPIQRLATDPDEETAEYSFTDNGPVTRTILQMLRETMTGKRQVEDGWLRDPFASKEEFCA